MVLVLKEVLKTTVLDHLVLPAPYCNELKISSFFFQHNQ